MPYFPLHLPGVISSDAAPSSSNLPPQTPPHLLPPTHLLHTEERPFTCEYCGHKSKSKSDLNMHTHLHTDTEHERQARRAILNERKRAYEARNVKEGRFSCDFCEFSAPNKARLVEHTRSHTGERPFKCVTCEFSSKTKKGLTDHTKIHGEKLSCSECDYKGTRQSDLNQHFKIHTGKFYFCNQCEFKSVRIDQLREHGANKHSDERPFSCDQCPHKSATRRSLNDHLKSHSPKIHKCSDCKYETKWSSCFTKHRRIHTGEKPFSCSLCDYKARVSHDLKSHVISKHTKPKVKEQKDKVFSCSVCDYTTLRKFDFTRHTQRKHPDGISFSRKQKLALRIRAHGQKLELNEESRNYLPGSEPSECLEGDQMSEMQEFNVYPQL